MELAPLKESLRLRIAGMEFTVGEGIELLRFFAEQLALRIRNTDLPDIFKFILHDKSGG